MLEAFQANVPAVRAEANCTREESCIGFATHIHYFDPPRAGGAGTQSIVALFAGGRLHRRPRIDPAASAPPLTAHVAARAH